MTRMNVESFNLDHTKVIAPYVRLVSVTTGKQGDTVHKYDLRFKQPNKSHMDMPGLHSLEHLLAESIRNHSNQVLDLSPMGCQTGFYLMMINHHDYEDLLGILEQTLTDVLAADAVPACNEVQCGFAASHNLTLAKVYAKDMLENRHQWANVFGPTKEEE